MFLKNVSIIALCTMLYSCSKENTAASNPQNSVGDSITLLTSVSATNGESLVFQYDANNHVTKINLSYDSKNPCYVYYKNGRLSHIIAEYQNPSYTPQRSSAIFLYGSNGKCSSVHYKNPVQINVVPDLNASYFTDLTDGEANYRYDTLLYSATNQLTGINEMSSFTPTVPDQAVKIYYANATDTVPVKFENYSYTSGVAVKDDELQITTNAIDNPAYSVWFYPFTSYLTYINDYTFGYMPILFDDPSCYLERLLPLVPKCITNYKVYNSYGSYNYTNSQFTYSYSADGNSLKGTATSAFDAITYGIKKVRK